MLADALDVYRLPVETAAEAQKGREEFGGNLPSPGLTSARI